MAVYRVYVVRHCRRFTFTGQWCLVLGTVRGRRAPALQSAKRFTIKFTNTNCNVYTKHIKLLLLPYLNRFCLCRKESLPCSFPHFVCSRKAKTKIPSTFGFRHPVAVTDLHCSFPRFGSCCRTAIIPLSVFKR